MFRTECHELTVTSWGAKRCGEVPFAEVGGGLIEVLPWSVLNR